MHRSKSNLQIRKSISSPASMAILLAKRFIWEGKYQETIKLLLPFYQKDAKTYNQEMVQILAIAWMEIPRGKKQALTLWTRLHQDEIAAKNYEAAFRSLISMIECQENLVQFDSLMQQALQITVEHQESFITRDPRTHKIINDSVLKNSLSQLYLSAAVLHERNGLDELDNITLQQTFYTKAQKYYEQALEQQPENIYSLLRYAKFMVCIKMRDADTGLSILLPQEKQHEKNPNFYFAVYKLYDFLDDPSNAELYKNKYLKYCKPGVNDKWTSIFSHITGSDRDDTSLQGKLDIVTMRYNQGKYDDTRKKLAEILQESPNVLCALELQIALESNPEAQGNTELALSLCERVLAVHPMSIPALTAKADLLWLSGRLHAAFELCEKAFEYGCESQKIFFILLQYTFQYHLDEKLIKYASLEIEKRPSSYAYLVLACGHFRLKHYEIALETFNMVRILDKYYYRSMVSLNIAYSLFQLAQTKEQYIKCAKKLRSYLSHLESNEHGPLVNNMLEKLKELNITVVDAATQPKQQENETKPEFPDNGIPEEIKIKIREFLESRQSFMMDKAINYSDDKLETKSETLYPIGDSKYGIYGYIPSNAKTASPEERKRFEDILKEGFKLEAGSPGKSGIKKLHNGRWAVKKADSDRRMVSTGTFFEETIRTFRPDIVKSNPNIKMLIRFGTVKTHSTLNKTTPKLNRR